MSDLYAWVTTMPSGEEGLVSIGTIDCQIPLVFVNLRVAPVFKAAALKHRAATGQPIKLLCFGGATVLDSEGYD